jgi:hypothetical protein
VFFCVWDIGPLWYLQHLVIHDSCLVFLVMMLHWQVIGAKEGYNSIHYRTIISF